MINKIKIKNFQCHKNLEVDLIKGINCIAGESDSGKSAFIRAVRWCIEDKPKGFNFKSWKVKPKESTEVKIEFDNGILIRKKNKEENSYYVNDKKFEALRGQIPDEVKQLHNLDYYNIQGQYDSVFLLQDSSGEVARKLNEIIGIDLIDSTLKNVNSAISKAKEESERNTKKIVELENEIKEFENLDDIAELINSIENNEDHLKILNKKKENINTVINETQSIQNELNLLPDLNKCENDIERINNLILQYQTYTLKFQCIKEISILENKIQKIEILLQNESKINAIFDNIHGIDKFEKEKNELQKLYKIIFDLEYKQIIQNTNICNIQEKINEITKEGGYCPTCNSYLNQEKLINMDTNNGKNI